MTSLTSISEIYNSLILMPEIRIFGHILGLIGMACIVVAYYLIERGRLHHNDAKYYITNLIGASLLEVSLLINFNLGSFVIEIFWIAISVVGLLRIRKKRLIQQNI